MPALMVPGIMPHVQPIVPLGDYQNLAARKYPYEYAASKSPKATPTYAASEPHLSSDPSEDFHQTINDPDDALLALLIRKYMDFVYWPDEKLEKPEDRDHDWMRDVIGEYYRLRGNPHKGGDKPHKGGDNPGNVIASAVSGAPAVPAPASTIFVASTVSGAPALPSPEVVVSAISVVPAITGAPALPSSGLIASAISGAPAVISIPGTPLAATPTTLISLTGMISRTGTPLAATPATLISLTGMISATGTPLRETVATIVSATGTPLATTAPKAKKLEPRILRPSFIARNRHLAENEQIDAQNEMLDYVRMVYGERLAPENIREYPQPVVDDAFVAAMFEIYAQADKAAFDLIMSRKGMEFSENEKKYQRRSVQIVDPTSVEGWEKVFAVPEKKDSAELSDGDGTGQPLDRRDMDLKIQELEETMKTWFGYPTTSAPEKKDSAELTEGGVTGQQEWPFDPLVPRDLRLEVPEKLPPLDPRHEMDLTIQALEERMKSKTLGYSTPSFPLQARATGGGTIWE